MKSKFIDYPCVIKGRYEIYENGNIYDTKNKKFTSPYVNDDGYYSIGLSSIRNGIKKSRAFLLHRLVGTAFIDNPDNLPMINHKDGNKLNPNVSNLEWCTAKHNNIHAIETGLRPIGEDCTYSTLTNSQVHDICKKLENGEKVTNIAKELGIHRGIIQNIKNGSSWISISKDYKFTKQTRIDIDTARKICEYLELGFKNKEIQELLHVTKSTILNIRNKSTWKEISCEYDFPRERPMMTKEQAHLVCKLLSEGKKVKTVSDESGVPYHAVHKIYKRKTWIEISSQYSF